MPVPGFGYSVGDIIATIEVIAKVVVAFKSGTGASDEYRQVVQELETLSALLQYISTIKSTDRNGAHVNAIKGIALNLQEPLRRFLDKICKRYGSLGRSQTETCGVRGAVAGLATAGRKARWAVDMGKDVAKLQMAVKTNMASLLLLLNINHLAAITFVEKLAKDNQNGLLVKGVEMQHELESQQTAIEGGFLQQTNLMNGLGIGFGNLASVTKSGLQDLASISQVNADRLGTIERRQSRDSAALLHFLGFVRSAVLSLRDVLPLIYDTFCKMILSHLHLYAVLVGLQATISQMPTLLLSDNIHFEDVLGRMRSLPYQSFRHWKVFRAFLECEFENLPGEQNIRHGLYRIADAKFESLVIGENEWSQSVFPGTQLNMSMIIESYRRKRGSCPRQHCPGRSQACGGSSPFCKCSECGLRYTDLRQSAVSRIVEHNSCPNTPSKLFCVTKDDKTAPKVFHGPAESASKNTHTKRGRDVRVDTPRPREDLGGKKQEMREREAREIFKFNRIYISSFEDMRDALKSLECYPGYSEDQGAAPLHKAAYMGDKMLVRWLIEDGADMEAVDNRAQTALHYAAKGGHGQVVQLLLDNGADIEAKGRNDWAAIHHAAGEGHGQVVRLLLENGAGIDAGSDRQLTALHHAARCGHEQVVQLLLRNGADIEAKTAEDGRYYIMQPGVDRRSCCLGTEWTGASKRGIRG